MQNFSPGNVFVIEIIAPEIGPKSFGTFEKRAPGSKDERNSTRMYRREPCPSWERKERVTSYMTYRLKDPTWRTVRLIA